MSETDPHDGDDDLPEDLPPGGEPEARRIVREVTGADREPIRAFFLAPPEGKKNTVVSYRTDEGKFVLKIYRQDARYTMQAMKSVVPRYITRAFTVRSLARVRVQAELDGIAGFREAGFQTFDVVSRPRRDALVFRHVPGEDLKTIIEEQAEPARIGAYVERLARDLARRQELALTRRDLRMIHPSPRVQHVWVRRDDAFVYYDFEDRVNPGLRIERALANEVECFFFYLLRVDGTATPEMLVRAREALGEAPMRRWAVEREKRRGWRFSGSARRRRGVYPIVADAGS